MAVWIKIVWKIIGWILTVIGLGGVSDDIEKWIEWLSSINPTLNQVAINMFDALHGDLGRWVFTLSGVTILLITYRVPQAVWHRLKYAIYGNQNHSSSPSGFLVECTSDRVEPYFQEITRQTKTTKLGIIINMTYQIWRISIKNLGSIDIPNVQVKLTAIQPVPPTLPGLDLPMIFMHDRSEPPKDSITLIAQDKIFVDIVSLLPGGPLMLEHSVSGLSKNITCGKYEIAIQVTGSNVPKVITNLCIWIEGQTKESRLCMEMLPD